MITVDAELRVGLLGPPADAKALPVVEAAAVLHAAKGKGVAQKLLLLPPAVSGIDAAPLGSPAGSDAEDSEDVPEASAADDSSDGSLSGQEGEELYESDAEGGGVVLDPPRLGPRIAKNHFRGRDARNGV